MKFTELPKRILLLVIMIILAVTLFVFNGHNPDFEVFGFLLSPYILKAYQTLLGVAVVYLIFKLIFEGAFVRGIRDYRTRYSLRKAVSVLYLAACLIIIVSVWLENTQNLLVAYGLIGAGIAIALQDFFKNFVGGVLVLINKIYSVGDRVEISGRYGDVIEIGVFYTTLMEIREWVSGDQTTGRLTTLPNGLMLTGVVNNYTKDHKFIWDEITLPLTYDSDWKTARTRFTEIVSKETEAVITMAQDGISKLKEKYYATQIRTLEPQIFVTPTDNWIQFDIRYVTSVYERRAMKSRISRLLLKEVQSNRALNIASATSEIVRFPELKVTKETLD
jgi:small-conductance mechanosensitive channel